MVQAEAAEEHCRRMQAKAHQQNEVIDVIIPAKIPAPEKNRIGHAQAVKNHGEQEKATVKM